MLNSAPAHLSRRPITLFLGVEVIDLIQAEPDLMEIVDRYGSELLKQGENTSPKSDVEQPEDAPELILRAIVVELPSTEINSMHAPTVEKLTYKTLILALGALP